MKQTLVNIALVVRDYDEAIAFYTKVLQFDLIEDTTLSATKRWVRVRPPGSGPEGCCILLARAVNETQEAAIGNQSGGRVFLFIHTDNFERDYANLVKHNVEIFRGPLEEDHGKVCVFLDLYGNKWDLIEPNAKPE